jgi:hypothetical protein
MKKGGDDMFGLLLANCITTMGHRGQELAECIQMMLKAFRL